ncbi:MAG: DUF1801 domain-containing protein [Hyphomicrobiales bacterium]|nr:MAG: DUF1801 domain-containing protein [Hyphomicrobiales bacterium]
MAKSTESVDELLARRGHRLLAEINALRAIVRGASPDIAEHVKWNGPSYYLVADPRRDMGNIVLARDKHVLLVLVFYDGKMIEHKLLTGSYADRRLLQLDDMAAIEANADAIAGIVRDWVALHE